ncbi:hypothetical protein ScPMuIL_008852 [Solemya velum]
MKTADALSRAPTESTEKSTSEEDVEAFVFAVLSNIQVSQTRKDEIRIETGKDKVLNLLKNTIMTGWPERRKDCKDGVSLYWGFRDELTIVDDMIFKGTRILIPSSMRNQMLTKIHVGHLGTEKCKIRARQVLFWPGINKDIDWMVKDCQICQQFQNHQPKEPLNSHELPHSPFEKVSTDLFQINNKDYIVVVDAYSNYPEVVQIPNQSSRVVIQAMKNIFSRHGIPKQILSDNGPCYRSQEFKVFSKEWDFQHVTSSPRYPKSNGLAEKTVQTMKNIIRKCCAAGDDVQLGLLAYRTTKLDIGLSSSELLMGRQLRNNLPSFVPDIKKGKRVAKDIIGWKHRQREKQKYYHDRTGVKSLPELGTKDQVRIRDSETGRKVTSKKAMQLKRQHKKDFQNNLEVVGMIPEAMKQYLSPKLRRIWMACSNPDSQTPCSGDQKWECRKENGRYRIYKCRGIGDTGKTRVQRDVPFLSQECPCDQERWKLSRQEKRNQRKFLRSHLGDRDFKPKFMRSKRSYLRTLNYSHDTFDLVDQSGTESPAFDVFDRRCRVLPNNTMTCDIQLYEDASEWKNHKTKLDDMIEEYQKMLDDLRHIRKHLKKSKPRKSYLSEIDNNESGPGFYTDDFNIDDGLEPDGEAVPCDCEEEEQLEQNEDDSTEAYYNIRKKGWTRKKNKPWRRRYSRKSCNAPDMNCFSHNNDHWKTPPLWPYGYFCFCTNSNNNTYWCLRTINATHNFLYCEFITNFISYYDFTVDPFQMKNKVHELNYGVLHQLRDELFRLRRCSGSRECYSRAGSRAYRRRQKDNNISDISADDINLNYDYSDYGVS